MRQISIIFVFILALSLIALSGCETATQKQEEVDLRPDGKPVYQNVALGGQVFKLELALTVDERHHGLSGRPALKDDEGMLFVYPDEPPYPVQLHFWMKDCPAPIDVVFLDPDGMIVSIFEMQPPEPGTPDDELERYSSGKVAQFAIELAGGRAADLELRVGDIVDLDCDYLISLTE